MLKLSFSQTILRYVSLAYGMSHPSVSVVCDIVVPYPEG